MKIILPARIGSEQLRVVRIPTASIVVAVGILIFFCTMFFGLVIGSDSALLLSASAIAGVLLITGGMISLYPSIFSLSTYRIPAMFVFSFTVLIMLVVPFVYADNPSSVRNTYLLATIAGFFFTIGGILLTHYFFPVPKKKINEWISAPVQSTSALRFMSVVLLLICYMTLALYLREVGTPPIVRAFQGGETTLQLAMAREDGLKLIEGRMRYLYVLNRNMLFPYTTLLLLSLALTERARRWKALFGISFAGSIFVAAATLEKSPTVAQILMLGFMWLIMRKTRLSLSRLALLGSFALGILILLYFALHQFDLAATGRIFDAMSNRIFYVPSSVLYSYFDYFPNKQDFLLGRGLPFVGKLFTEGSFPVTNVICRDRLEFVAIESCSANAAYFGTLWADFGWFGICIGGLIVGCIIQGIQLLIIRLPKSMITVALQSFICFRIVMLTSTTLPDVLLSGGIGYATVLTLVLLPFAVPKKYRSSLVRPLQRHTVMPQLQRNDAAKV